MFFAMLLAAIAPSDPVELAFQQAHQNYQAHAKDQFTDTDIDKSFLGKPFRMVRPLHDLGESEGGGPYCRYDNGKLELVFEPDPQPFASNPPPVLFDVGGTSVIERSYVGSNGFGAKSRVAVQRLRENALEMRDRPAGVVDPELAAIPGVAAIEPQAYSVEIQISGAEARALTKDVRIVIEGTIAPLVGGGATYCKPLDREATFSSPIEVHGEQCWIGANVSRVAFVRGSGEVIKEWK